MNQASTISQRLSDLREVMRREHLGAFIFPSTDPHNGEYVPDHWKGREWISGFDGSAGTAVVTMDSAALWTDSRYFIAAEEQLAGTEFQLMKLKVEGTPTIAQWLGQQLETTTNNTQRPESTEVGIDGSVCSASMVEQLITDLRREGGLTLRTNLDPLKLIWHDRPSIPENPIEIHPLEMTGKSCREKLTEIRSELRKKHADGMLVAALDDIAWTLNLRGSDVHCNPVFVSYLLIDTKKATLFVNRKKLTPAVVSYLQQEGVGVDDYERVGQGLKDYFEYNILQAIPYFIVLVLSIIGINVFIVLITGSLLFILVGMITGSLTYASALSSMGGGISGMFETMIVTILVASIAALMRANGGFAAILSFIRNKADSRRGGMFGIAFLTAFMDVATANNTVAIVIAAPIARDITEEYKVDPKVTASLLDTCSCIMQGIIPYGAQLLVAANIAKIASFSLIPFLFYPFILAVFVVLSILVSGGSGRSAGTEKAGNTGNAKKTRKSRRKNRK